MTLRAQIAEMRRSAWHLAFVAGLLFAGACAPTPHTDALRLSTTDGLPRSAELDAVPFHAQTEFHCGPAALTTVLEDYGLDLDTEDLAKAVFTPGREGSLQADMVTAARRNGVMTVPVRSLRAAFQQIDAGRPVLVLQNLALEIAPQWHYAVLVGYDIDAGIVVLRSGTERRRVTEMETFEHTWRRSGNWGFVVVHPANPPPDFASMTDWLAEGAGLERAGHDGQALQAYRTAVRAWPDAWQPWFALGNSRFARGELASAEANLREAVKRSPDNWMPLNNLAYVVLQAGRPDEALPLAQKAVELAGVDAAEAEATLAEVEEALSFAAKTT